MIRFFKDMKELSRAVQKQLPAIIDEMKKRTPAENQKTFEQVAAINDLAKTVREFCATNQELSSSLKHYAALHEKRLNEEHALMLKRAADMEPSKDDYRF